MDGFETGVDFNFTYAPGITEDQILGVELAGEMWSNYLADTHQTVDKKDVTYIENTVINIYVEVGSDLLPDDVIGGAFPAVAEEKYEDIYDALIGDVTTDSDRTATDSLLNGRKTNILVNGELRENDKMQLTTANLKALDLIDSASKEGESLDGYILLSDLSNFSTVEWNYDYLGGAQPGTLDFLTTVAHEIGHTLGFISGTDRVALTNEALGYYQSVASVDILEQAFSIKDNGGYFVDFDEEDGKVQFEGYEDELVDFDPEYEEKDEKKFLEARDKFLNSIEILREFYSSSSDTVFDAKEIQDAFKAVDKYLKYDSDWEGFIEEDNLFNETKNNLDLKKLAKKMTTLDLFRYSDASSVLGVNELTRGVDSYFSLDGSKTDLAMSNGQDYQGSHWQDRDRANGLGIMNPTVALNERWEISDNDLLALDAIGWDVDYSQSLDIQALYNNAAAKVDSAWIGDREDDVVKIIGSEAYDARRSRTGRTARGSGYGIAVDGYFSTFSEPVATTIDSSSDRVIAYIDNPTVTANSPQQQPIEAAEEDSSFEFITDNAVEEVEVMSLELDEPAADSSLLTEMVASLEAGWEIAIATSTL